MQLGLTLKSAFVRSTDLKISPLQQFAQQQNMGDGASVEVTNENTEESSLQQNVSGHQCKDECNSAARRTP